MISLHSIRKTFLNFFHEKDHTIIRSSPLIPHNDPTLLFTNAGMVQFKDIFTGAETPSLKRATTSQKCLRAGGKHNDLDNVGYTARHHTFFEMLGNFSFGDYFKEESIEYAWTLVTEIFCLDPKRLWITVYAEDLEAYKLWQRFVPMDRIIKIATSDNFWMMGDIGPCGPCSEIFYDHGDHIPGGLPGSAEQDGDRFIEIWNLVFMQYEQKPDGTRISLPQPSIDTGMGLERIAAVLQGVHNNYETDLFKTLIQESVKRTQTEPHQSHRVIADHLRASAFLIADGVLPSNEGRGYVLRRIMRRSMRHAYLLRSQEPLMHQLVPTLVALMGGDYPELCKAQSLMTDVLKIEEERFRQTLEKGLKLLQEATKPLKTDELLSGEVAFKLYDTYGFPLDLTQDVLREEKREVDLQDFQTHMEAQRQKARESWVGSGEIAQDHLWLQLREKYGKTDFLGYTHTHAESLVVALVNKNGECVDELCDEGIVITHQTPFHGESGGQKGDHGFLKTSNAYADITNTLKKADLILHYVVLQAGILSLQDSVSLHVNIKRRQGLAQHHSATHLLHSCLRKVLGEHVMQKGSLVEEDRLRFDFTHLSPVTQEQIQQVEDYANAIILENHEAHINWMSYDQALNQGAIALFGEKYGESVRVIKLGEQSIELCGGTHVTRTGDIGLLKITHEASVASGVRRIEAVAGQACMAFIRTAMHNWQKEKEQLITALHLAKKKKPQNIIENFEHFQVNHMPIYALSLESIDTKTLKMTVDEQRKKIEKGIIIVSSHFDGKVSFVVAVENMTLNAITIVQQLSAICGGKGGGGRPDLAQGGGIITTPFTQLPQVLLGILL